MLIHIKINIFLKLVTYTLHMTHLSCPPRRDFGHERNQLQISGSQFIGLWHLCAMCPPILLHYAFSIRNTKALDYSVPGSTSGSGPMGMENSCMEGQKNSWRPSVTEAVLQSNATGWRHLRGTAVHPILTRSESSRATLPELRRMPPLSACRTLSW